MKKGVRKGVMLAAIQLIVVATVLTLTVVSYAWYVSHNTVHTEGVTITASETSNVSIITEPDDYTPYKGETGLGYLNAPNPELVLDLPYTAEKMFTVTFKPAEQQTYALLAYFYKIDIAKTDDTLIDAVSDPQIMDSFTFRLHIYDEDNSRIATFAPESDSKFLVLVDGDLAAKGDYLIIEEQTTLRCGFEVVFLSEQSYSDWLDERYLDLQEFRYCDYSFMRAMFHISFVAGMGLYT